MAKTVNFIFCVHNHQPIDNFGYVFEMAYHDAYKPFVDVMEKYPQIKFCAHYSGCLMEWLKENKIEICTKMMAMAQAERLEILGGGFYEPIFTSIPEADLSGQLNLMNDFIMKQCGEMPQGVWVPERVWEQHLTKTLVDEGFSYTILDDFHFKAAGLKDEDLTGFYITEYEGRLLKLFPIKEDLRYSIPFKDPQWTIDYLKSYATEDGNRVIVYADDGEKFGIWPHTKKHVYEDGWLERFLKLLSDNSDCIRTITFSEAISKFKPAGKIYLPSCSYREMGEWAVLNQGRETFDNLNSIMKNSGVFDGAKQFVPGGSWQNFKIKYPEANLMYGRMLGISNIVNSPKQSAPKDAVIELYKAQCNCAHWHGVFGGIYLPHLRNSVYSHLIEAENIMEKERTKASPEISLKETDLDLDGSKEIRLYNNILNLFISPERGGHIVETDLRDRKINISNVISRHSEVYHKALLDIAQRPQGEGVKTIHEISAIKDIKDASFAIDKFPHQTLTEHFFIEDTTIKTVSGSTYEEMGDFIAAPYEATVTKKENKAIVTLKRDGIVKNKISRPLSIEKEIMLGDKSEFAVTYTMKNIGSVNFESLFGVEYAFSIFRETTYKGDNGKPAGSVRTENIFSIERTMAITDDIMKLAITLIVSERANVFIFPINTISQSESGLEAIFQGVVAIPHWKVKIEPGAFWRATITTKFANT